MQSTKMFTWGYRVRFLSRVGQSYILLTKSLSEAQESLFITHCITAYCLSLLDTKTMK